MRCANTARSGTEEQARAFARCIRTRSVTRDTGTVQNSLRQTKGGTVENTVKQERRALGDFEVFLRLLYVSPSTFRQAL